jgi:cytochrome c553
MHPLSDRQVVSMFQPRLPLAAQRSRAHRVASRLLGLLPLGPLSLGLLPSGFFPGVVAAQQEAITGAAIYHYCESCHGERGAGGESGKYPRIAGLPAAYIDKQLHDFKAQRRVNKPMIPIFKHHRFDEAVIDTVSEHIAAMRPPGLALWPYAPSSEAIAVYGSKQALAAAGAEQYQAECAGCHGPDASGRNQAPPLVDQYPAYLAKQIRDFGTGQREHRAAEHCGAPDAAQTEALLHQIVELGKGAF